MEKEATRGNRVFQKFLANAYVNGIGVEKDYTKAMKWCRILATGAQKDYYKHWAETAIGFMYQFGHGVRRDPKEARKWYSKAARFGHSSAWYRLGMFYHTGTGGEKNIKKAERCYRLAAKKHNYYAQNALAYMWAEKGEHLAEARKMIDAALRKRHDEPNFIDTSGWIYYKAGDYDKAVKELKRAADIREDAVVLDHLGDAYSKLGEKPEAERSWRRALNLTTKKQSELKEKIQKKLNTASQQI
jgi:TPR repeat protein